MSGFKEMTRFIHWIVMFMDRYVMISTLRSFSFYPFDHLPRTMSISNMLFLSVMILDLLRRGRVWRYIFICTYIHI